MELVGIRELKQQTSAVVARVVAGETITVSDRGRPVARLVPLAPTRYESMADQGRVRKPKRRMQDLPQPRAGKCLGQALSDLRDDERF